MLSVRFIDLSTRRCRQELHTDIRRREEGCAENVNPNMENQANSV